MMGQFLAAGFSRLVPPRVLFTIDIEWLVPMPGDRSGIVEQATGECEKLTGTSTGGAGVVGSTFSSPSVSDAGGSLICSTIRCCCNRVMRRD